jgi:hypothetical protein
MSEHVRTGWRPPGKGMIGWHIYERQIFKHAVPVLVIDNTPEARRWLAGQIHEHWPCELHPREYGVPLEPHPKVVAEALRFLGPPQEPEPKGEAT